MTTLQQYVNILTASGTSFWDGHGLKHPKDRFLRVALSGLSTGALGVLLISDALAGKWAVASGLDLTMVGQQGTLKGSNGIKMVLTFSSSTASGTLALPKVDASGAINGTLGYSVALSRISTPGLPPVGPTASPPSYAVATNAVLSVPASRGVLIGVTDPNPGATNFSAYLFGPPLNGSLTLHSDGSFVYTPRTGFAGSDSFSFTVKGSDKIFSALAVAFIDVGFFIRTNALPPAGPGAAYSAQLQAVGGILPYTWASSGTLPAGLKLSSSGLLSGTPLKTDTAGTYTIDVSAVDSSSPPLSSTAFLPLALV